MYSHGATFLPTNSKSLQILKKQKKTKSFLLNALKPIRFQFFFSASKRNVLEHHQFLSGASITLQQQLSFKEFLSGSLHCSFLVQCLLSFLHCWIPVSSTENWFLHSPDIIHLAFLRPSCDTSSSLQCMSLLILLPIQTRLRQNFTTSSILSPNSFLFHSRHSRTLVQPVACT